MKKVCFIDDLESNRIYRRAKSEKPKILTKPNLEPKLPVENAKPVIPSKRFTGNKNPQNITILENNLLQKRNIELEEIIKKKVTK